MAKLRRQLRLLGLQPHRWQWQLVLLLLRSMVVLGPLQQQEQWGKNQGTSAVLACQRLERVLPPAGVAITAAPVLLYMLLPWPLRALLLQTSFRVTC